jgi:predicted DNA binding CopG/RHH family protein
MKKPIKYSDEPIGKLTVVEDFLPAPAELAFREESVKVTLALSKRSIEFFKSQANQHKTQYQRMIRRLVDSYVDKLAPTRLAI